MSLTDEQLLRYSRHIMLPALDVAGQERLLASRVLIIGLGGLGAPVAMYLAASGVGHLVLVDFDEVELSNLQRQIIHDTDSIGKTKVESARKRIHALNPDVKLTLIDHRLSRDQLVKQARHADVIIDASDNFDARYLINEVGVQTHTPLVSGAVIRFEGQVTVFTNKKEGPCYRCLYPKGETMEESCSETGILAPVAGIIGAIQATETCKLLTGIGETLEGRLLLLDARQMTWRTVKLRQDAACPVCSTKTV